MRVLVVHNRYRMAGGEDVAVEAEIALLREHGHDVHTWIVSNTDLDWRGMVQILTRPAHSTASQLRMAALLTDLGPDIVHVHNFFPILTPSIFDACAAHGVPAVQSLHNYRLLCPKATMFRDGEACELCLSGSPFHAVRFGCYRDSRIQSLAVARMIAAHRRRATWQTKVARFIVLTEFARDRFIEGGLPSERISVKPNFAADPAPSNGVQAAEPDGNALYVGRLSEEKGVGPLMDAWQELRVPLRIVGDGPLMESVKRAAGPMVAVLGAQPKERVQEEMSRASFLVVPSLAYEGFPMTLAEAFACGVPAIVTRHGAMKEIVEDGVSGLHVDPDDPADLAAKVRWAGQHPDRMRQMGRTARSIYEQKYTPMVNYQKLLAIYNTAIDPVVPTEGV